MTRKLEEVSRVGGSVRIGSTGTVSSLMSRELESSSSSSRRNPQSKPVSVSCGDRTFKLSKSMNEVQKSGTRSNIKQRSPENIIQTRGKHQDRISVMGLATPKRQKQKSLPEEARGNSSRDGNNRRSPDLQGKTRSHKRTHHIPMLGAEDVALDRTQRRDKPTWKVNLVEVVDTNCGIPAGSVSSRLKKLGFAKLSQSII